MKTNTKNNVSIIIPAKNEGINILNTIKSIISSKTNMSYEIIIVDDGSKENRPHYYEKYFYDKPIIIKVSKGLGVAGAKQFGSRYATGKILLFCDAHVFVEDLWLDKLAEPLEKGELDAICPSIAPHDGPHHCGYGQTWDSNLGIQWLPNPRKISTVPLLPGGCMAVKSSIFHKIGGFDEGFQIWGYEDGEISLKLWLMGYRIGVHPRVKILHVFRKKFPYYVDSKYINYNLLRMAYIHFNQKRIQKVLAILDKKINNRMQLERFQKQVLKKEVFDLRKWFILHRQYDDDWFFKKFRIPF